MTTSHEIKSKDDWTAARKALLTKEKELTKLRDEVASLRRALPWRRVETAYSFASKDGARSLAELFDGKNQLLVYHFMFGPDWEEGCPSCSFWADHFDAMRPHLAARDTAFAVISSGPVKSLGAYAERMGWRFPWVSSADNDFNQEFAVTFSEAEAKSDDKLYNFGTSTAGSSELPGASAFIRDGEDIFHTYSTYARGLDILNTTYHWLDMTAKGRDESELPWPMAWVKRHDKY